MRSGRRACHRTVPEFASIQTNRPECDPTKTTVCVRNWADSMSTPSTFIFCTESDLHKLQAGGITSFIGSRVSDDAALDRRQASKILPSLVQNSKGDASTHFSICTVQSAEQSCCGDDSSCFESIWSIK